MIFVVRQKERERERGRETNIEEGGEPGEGELARFDLAVFEMRKNARNACLHQSV